MREKNIFSYFLGPLFRKIVSPFATPLPNTWSENERTPGFFVFEKSFGLILWTFSKKWCLVPKWVSKLTFRFLKWPDLVTLWPLLYSGFKLGSENTLFRGFSRCERNFFAKAEAKTPLFTKKVLIFACYFIKSDWNQETARFLIRICTQSKNRGQTKSQHDLYSQQKNNFDAHFEPKPPFFFAKSTRNMHKTIFEVTETRSPLIFRSALVPIVK